MGPESNLAILSDYKAQKKVAQDGPRLAKQPLVLVVEDEVLVRMAVSADLRAYGFGVIEAHDADEAAEVLRMRDDVDVVFSDIVMPGQMNGADLALTWMRKNTPAVPILLTSGVAHGLLSVEGAGLVIPKPYDTETVAATLRSLITSRTSH